MQTLQDPDRLTEATEPTEATEASAPPEPPEMDALPPVEPLPDLDLLTDAQKVELIRKQHADLQQTRTEVARILQDVSRTLEEAGQATGEVRQTVRQVTGLMSQMAALQQAKFTPPSSLPKPNVPKGRRRRTRKGRPGRRRH